MKTKPRNASVARREATPAPVERLKLPEIPWARVISGLLVVLLIVGLFYRFGDIDAIHEEARRLNAGVALALLLFLPLIGFPVSILHVAAGIRFGPALGQVFVALTILLQLLISYALVRLWRSRFEEASWLKSIRRRVPQGAHHSICLLTVLLPGAPFAAINYVLPLLGISLRTYLLVCLPVHTLRSTITVMLGGHSRDLTPARVAMLLGYAALVLTAMWWTYRRVRSRLEDQPRVAGDRTQPA